MKGSTSMVWPDAPAGWSVAHDSIDGRKYVHALMPMSCILSVAEEEDGRRWIHFSLAHPHRLPKWDELVRYKEQFLGEETTAVQVLAPRSRWVNIHPYCLHLFVCLDGNPLPDFTRGGKSL